MKLDKHAKIAACPACAEKCYLGIQPKLEQKVTCPNCRSLLKVICLCPPKLGWEIGDEEEQAQEYWKEESW